MGGRLWFDYSQCMVYAMLGFGRRLLSGDFMYACLLRMMELNLAEWMKSHTGLLTPKRVRVSLARSIQDLAIADSFEIFLRVVVATTFR